MWWPNPHDRRDSRPGGSTTAGAGTTEPPSGEGTERVGRIVGWGGRVFISHTSELAAWPQQRSCVDEALAAAAEADYLGLDMKHFSAQDRPPAKVCVEAVRSCGVYVAVIGFRYGSIVPNLSISYTELEFNTATERGIRRIVIMLSDASGAPIEQDAEEALADGERARRFRDRLAKESGLTVKYVNNAGEVHDEVRKSLQLVPPPPGWFMTGPEGTKGVRGGIERRGRGHRVADGGGDLFRGRTAALAKVTEWLRAPEAPGRVLVVIGQPGGGKSALVARAVLNLEPDAVNANHLLGLAFHARSATVKHLLDAVAAVTRVEAETTVDAMIARMRDLPPPAGGGAWRLVVDALDEAGPVLGSDEPENLTVRKEIARALVQLARAGWRVVVATRPLAPEPKLRFNQGLLPELGVEESVAVNLVDLDEDPYFDSTAVVEFAAALLGQDGAANPPVGGAWQHYRADPGLRQRVAQAIGRQADRNYLVAALAADPLSARASVADPDDPQFLASLPSSIRDALDKYLDQQPPRDRAQARGLLTALAYARGSGIDDQRWIAFANAIGYAVRTVDLEMLRGGAAADYLLQSPAMDGDRLTRLFHQALTDELLVTRPRQSDEAKILTCLLPSPPATWAQASRYARIFAADHATAAGKLDQLLEDPFYPAVADMDRLLTVLPDDPSPGVMPMVRLLRIAGPQAIELPARRRAQFFTVVAAQMGLTTLSQRWQDVFPVAWAHAQNAPHRRLISHTDAVNQVALGYAGGRHLIVSGSDDGSVQMWDAVTGLPLGDRWIEGNSRVGAVAIGRADDRDLITSTWRVGFYERVSGPDAGTGWRAGLAFWDAGTGDPVGDLMTIDKHSVNSITVGRVDGRDMIVTETSTAIQRWDLATREPIGPPLTEDVHNVTCLAMGQVGDREVILCAKYNTLLVWEAATGEPVGHPLVGDDTWIHALAAGTVNGRDIAFAGNDDGTIRIWDLGSGDLIGQPLNGHIGRIWALTVARIGDRDLIVSGGEDHRLRVWDATTFEPIGEPLTGHTGAVRSLVLGRAGTQNMIVSGAADATVRTWEIGILAGAALPGRSDPVLSLALGRGVLVSGSADMTVRLWDVATGEAVGQPLVGQLAAVHAVATGRLGGRDVIVSGCDGGEIRIWDAAAYTPVGPVLSDDGGVTALAIGHIGNLDVIVSGHADRMLRIWDAVTGQRMREIEGHSYYGYGIGVLALALMHIDDRDIIVAAGGTSVGLWDAATGMSIDNISAGDNLVRTVAAGRVGARNLIVAGGDDGTIRVWDMADMSKEVHIPAHTGAVLAVTIASVGALDTIVSGGQDGTVCIWDAADYDELATIDTLDPVHAVAIHSEQLFVATVPAIVALNLNGE